MASKSFMSTAPRPQTQPSATSPANGGTDQSSALAGTTSRCPWISSGDSDRSTPSGSQLATTEVRLGAGSNSSAAMPTSPSSSATRSAATRSPGPGSDP